MGEPYPGRPGLVVCPSGAPGKRTTTVARERNEDPKTLLKKLRTGEVPGGEAAPAGRTPRHFVRSDPPAVTPATADGPEVPGFRERIRELEREVESLRAENRRLRQTNGGLTVAISGLQDALRPWLTPDTVDG